MAEAPLHFQEPVGRYQARHDTGRRSYESKYLGDILLMRREGFSRFHRAADSMSYEIAIVP